MSDSTSNILNQIKSNLDTAARLNAKKEDCPNIASSVFDPQVLADFLNTPEKDDPNLNPYS